MASIGYFMTAYFAFHLFGEAGDQFILRDTYALLGVYFVAKGFAHIELSVIGAAGSKRKRDRHEE